MECGGNQLTTLDVSYNPRLNSLFCGPNQLRAINLKNGNNKNLSFFDARENPQLTCLQVDDATAFKKKWRKNVNQPNVISNNCIVKVSAITIKTADGSNTISTNGGTLQFVATATPATATDKSVTWSVDNPSIAYINKHGILIGVANGTVKVTATSQDGSRVVSNSITVIITQQRTRPVVNIPDANFKKALLANYSINTNKDKEIQLYEANTFYGKIMVRNISIKDLTGIEAFTSLKELHCDYNQLTTLDVSNNTQLSVLNCDGNQLTTLDVTKNTKLTKLDCDGNQLTTLNVSNNTQLIGLGCKKNQLRVINLKNGNNKDLDSFDARENPQLTCIQVDNATKFKNAIGFRFHVDQPNAISNDCIVQVTSITIAGKGGATTITANGGKLQMVVKSILPRNADFKAVTWSVDNATLASISSSGLLTAKANGTVMVTATATDGYGVSRSANIVISNQVRVTSLESSDLSDELVLYPNPTQDRLSIETSLIIRQIIITDLAGKVLKTIDGNRQSIDVSTLSPNIYFLRLSTEKGITYRKFLKE